MSLDCVLCGDETIRGSRIRVGRNTFVSLCGDTKIDMRELPPQHANFHFIIVRLCGNIKMYVPRGTNVTLRRFTLCGSRDIDLDDENDPELNNSSSPPNVKITYVTLCGDVRVTN